MDENFAKIIRTWQIENLIGRVMLIIETMGLNESQLNASKSLIKQMIWQQFNDGMFISKEKIEEAVKENEKKGFSNLSQ